MIDVNHDDIILRTFILFVQTAREVMKYADAYLHKKACLSTVKLVALQALASNNRAMTPSEIAEWTQTERHNITTLINRMKRDGLVKAKRQTADKRFVDVTLTDKGREALKRCMPMAKEIIDQVMLPIDAGDAAHLEKQLRRLRQNAHYGLEDSTNLPQPRSG